MAINSKAATKKNKVIIALIVAVIGVSALCLALIPRSENHSESSEAKNKGGKGDKDKGQEQQDGSSLDSQNEVGCVKTPMDDYLPDWDLPSYDVMIEEDVLYGKGLLNDGKEMDLELDIYRPSTSTSEKDDHKYPLMIHIHGGSFKGGDKSGRSTGNESSSGWARRGYVVASINYRLDGDGPVLSAEAESLSSYVTDQSAKGDPIVAMVASLEDTLAAYDFMKSMSYVNDEIVVLNGYSAGAISGLWTTYGIDNFGYNRPPIKAIISHWGSLVTNEEEMKYLIPSTDVPAFLVHATGDSVVSYAGTQQLANRFERLGMPYVLHCRDSGDHSISIDSVEHQEGLTVLEAEQFWLNKILKDA